MKKLTIIAAAAVLLGGISIAAAQNAPTTKDVTSPNSINKGSVATRNSGAES